MREKNKARRAPRARLPAARASPHSFSLEKLRASASRARSPPVDSHRHTHQPRRLRLASNPDPEPASSHPRRPSTPHLFSCVRPPRHAFASVCARGGSRRRRRPGRCPGCRLARRPQGVGPRHGRPERGRARPVAGRTRGEEARRARQGARARAAVGARPPLHLVRPTRAAPGGGPPLGHAGRHPHYRACLLIMVGVRCSGRIAGVGVWRRTPPAHPKEKNARPASVAPNGEEKQPPSLTLPPPASSLPPPRTRSCPPPFSRA